MGAHYTQFTLEERCTLARLQAAGHSLRQIAAALGRAPSTVAREVTRNAGRPVGYAPAYAEQQAQARRWHGSRLSSSGRVLGGEAKCVIFAKKRVADKRPLL